LKQDRTWKDVVVDALRELGGEGNLKEIAAIAKRDPKAATNTKVREKVRQIVRQYRIFETDEEGSGIYRLASGASLKDLNKAATTKSVTDEIQGKLLYIGRTNNYETFAPADDCTKRKFAGRQLSHFVSVRDIFGIPRFKENELKTMARIDVLWLSEIEGDLLPRFAFEIENSTKVLTGLTRMSIIPRWFQTKLVIAGKDESQRRLYEDYLNRPTFKARADNFRFLLFDEVRNLFGYSEVFDKARAANETAMKAAGLSE
jgi:hypothetical protein